MSGDMGAVDGFVGEMANAVAKQQEEWLRGLGIKTEDDARIIARDWMIEWGPLEVVDAGDNQVKATQTTRLVRRPNPDTPPKIGT